MHNQFVLLFLMNSSQAADFRACFRFAFYKFLQPLFNLVNIAFVHVILRCWEQFIAFDLLANQGGFFFLVVQKIRN